MKRMVERSHGYTYCDDSIRRDHPYGYMICWRIWLTFQAMSIGQGSELLTTVATTVALFKIPS